MARLAASASLARLALAFEQLDPLALACALRRHLDHHAARLRHDAVADDRVGADQERAVVAPGQLDRRGGQAGREHAREHPLRSGRGLG